MDTQKHNLTTEQVGEFLAAQDNEPTSQVAALSGGEWSQAFAFRRKGAGYVVRFGHHVDDYRRDQHAVSLATTDLPIPKVITVGKATPFEGYFAISERASGSMLDSLDAPHMRRAVPAVLRTLDAIRHADISKTTGYGQINVDGNGLSASWRDHLLGIARDEPGSRLHGWRQGLQASPVNATAFEAVYARLETLSSSLPEVRSLVHNDMLNNNVLVKDDRVTAVIDWGSALYGDFLYDLAMFVNWSWYYPAMRGIDWKQRALDHYTSQGLAVPSLERRLRCYQLRLYLEFMRYAAYRRQHDDLSKQVNARALQLAGASL